MKLGKFSISTILLLAALSAQAHHAMEFIELESYSTAPMGAFVYHLHYDYMVDDKDQPNLDHWELTPGMSYGISDRLMVDVHGHFAKFGTGHLIPSQAALFAPMGPSPFFEAIAAALQYRITESGGPVEVAVSLTYEEPFKRSVDLLDGQRVFAGTLILNKPLKEHRNLLLNLCAERDGDEMDYGWGLGLRSPLTPDAHGIAGGIEFLGDFEGNITFLPGVYFPLGMQDIVFKSGIEIDPEDGAVRSNLTLMYRF